MVQLQFLLLFQFLLLLVTAAVVEVGVEAKVVVKVSLQSLDILLAL